MSFDKHARQLRIGNLNRSIYGYKTGIVIILLLLLDCAIMNPPQQQQQFLSNVLSQRSLPYKEEVKWVIRQHLVTLTETYPNLQPRTASFTHNDGRSVILLESDGTIPMLFHNVTYNIPVVIWLMETYPHHPPCIYVVPAHNMIIKRPHPYVNPCGLVSVPYLQNWIYPSSNLVQLVRTLTSLFSRDPPLYTRSPNPVPNSDTNLTTWTAINKLSQMLIPDLDSLRNKREGDIEALFNVQSQLRQRKDDLSKGLRDMQEEIGDLEQQLQMVLTNTNVTEAWLKENEDKMKNPIHVEDLFEPSDRLSKQMFESTALDLAIEDLIYSLDKAVQQGSVDFYQYLKNVRSLSRHQFFHRATSAKVRAVQMHTQLPLPYAI